MVYHYFFERHEVGSLSDAVGDIEIIEEFR